MTGINQLQRVISEDELSTNQRLFDYDTRTDGQPVYIGVADRGALEGNEVWVIRKYTFDGDGYVTKEQTAVNSSWTNRATATYL